MYNSYKEKSFEVLTIPLKYFEIRFKKLQQSQNVFLKQLYSQRWLFLQFVVANYSEVK